MKLSIWTFEKYLEKDGFKTEAHITDGHPYISLIRQSTRRSYSQDAELIQAGNNCILACDMDSIVIYNADISKVANSLNCTLELFSEWEMNLYDNMLRGASLQELLEIANEVFERPMFIKNDSTRTFAVTKGYSGNVHPHWKKIENSMEEDLLDYDLVKTLSDDPEFKEVFHEKYPSLRWSPSYKNVVLHSNVFLKGRRVAEIVVLENKKPFNRADVHILNTFSSLVEAYVNNNPGLFQTGSDAAVFLNEFIEKGFVQNEQIRTICSTMGQSEAGRFCLLVVSGIGRYDSPALSVLREKLQSSLSRSIVISSMGYVVALMALNSDETYDSVIANLKKYIPREGFCWALSYDFLGIDNIPAHFELTKTLLDNETFKSDHYVTMYQKASELIFEMCKGAKNATEMIHPDLITLENTDMEEGTAYCRTLYWYLLCGGNFTDAAKILDLHRNTLIYRMNKIRELVRTNIDDPENRKLLLYSFLILGTDF